MSESLGKHSLGFKDSAALILGIVIGVGIFKVPAQTASVIPSPLGIILAWTAGGVISLLGALCFAELAARFPKTGGLYIYLKESYGPVPGFLFVWVDLFFIRPGSIAAVAFIFSDSILKLFSLNPAFLKPVALAGILLLILANLKGLHVGKRIQNSLVVCILLLLFIVLAAAFFNQGGRPENIIQAQEKPEAGLLTPFILSLIPILWAYGGWHENIFVAGETRNPSKTVPAALIAAIVLVTFIYVGVVSVFLHVMPLEQLESSRLIMADAARILFGEKGEALAILLILITALGSMNGTLITGSRVSFAWLEDLLPNQPFKRLLNGSIWLVGVLSILLLLWGSFEKLLYFTGFFVWVFFALAAYSLFIFRRKKMPYAEFRVPFFPFIPLFFILVCAVLVVNTLVSYTAQSLTGFFLLLLGIPVYLLLHKRKKL